MTTISASFRSVEAEITSYQALSQRQALAVNIGNDKPKPSSILNSQQKQIVDDVGISAEALQKFEDAQALAEQLQNYLDYLYGRDDESDVSIKITPANDNADVEIAGRSTRLSASFTQDSITEKTLDITVELDDEGNLDSLSITKTQTNIEFISAQVSLSDTQFYARV